MVKRIFLALTFCLVLGRHPARADGDMVLQSTSFDCGPAALATLLDKYLGVPTTEQEMVKLTGADPKDGTTLLQMEKAVKTKGGDSNSYRMDWKTLQEQVTSFPVPVIVRMLNPEPHFVVLMGIEKDTVYLADPGAGFLLMSEKDFTKRWLLPVLNTGYVFIAVGPEGTVNEARRKRVLTRLAKQRATLQNWSIPLQPIRR